jgi:hypothetical protein
MALPDYAPFAMVAARMRADLLSSLTSSHLPEQRRAAFYAFGAGLALLLDLDVPGWHARYLTEKFAIERYLAPAG